MSDNATTNVEESSGPGVPAWMLTYADTVTLLMTFFVMLMSFSTFDKEKFAKIRGSLVGHLGIVGEERLSRDSLLPRRHMDASRVHLRGYENPPNYDPLSYLQESFEILVREKSLANLLDYKLTEQGFEIHLLTGTLFKEGSAQLKSGAESVLNRIGETCARLPHNLRVTAHADIFYPEEYARPQELAVDRAAAVCGYLHTRSSIAAERLSVAAPVSGEDPRVLQGKASQVRIVVLRPSRRRTQ